MTSYAYEAVNAAGASIRGTMDVASQSEALKRIKEMGLYPTRVAERQRATGSRPAARARPIERLKRVALALPAGRVKPAALTVFTRQLATLVDAGLPLLRGLRILEQQETNRALKRILGEVGTAIESGNTLSEALMAHPKVFNRLFVNMVRAGETSGALEVVLQRLAEFMEKAQKIKNKVKSAMFYPVAVMFVATAILGLMLVYILPRFQQVFNGLLNGAAMPPFTTFILRLSDLARHHALVVAGVLVVLAVCFTLARRTPWGRLSLDQFKLKMPILGAVFRKVAISRFARTLGTLLGSGVPVLQALTIVKETTGNVVVGRVVTSIHDCVKEGEPITAPLRASSVFPPMVVGMVDVGEQTGALPDMLLKIADNYDDEVDNAVNSMTSLLEPILIVFLAVVVGSIVIAMFLPILAIVNNGFDGQNADRADG